MQNGSFSFYSITLPSFGGIKRKVKISTKRPHLAIAAKLNAGFAFLYLPSRNNFIKYNYAKPCPAPNLSRASIGVEVVILIVYPFADSNAIIANRPIQHRVGYGESCEIAY